MPRVKLPKFPWDEKRSLACAAVAAGVVALALAFFARSPRSHLNIMQAMAVLFFMLALIRLSARKENPREEVGGSSELNLILPALTMTLAAGIWATGLNSYFINDDFGLLSVTPRLNTDLLAWLFGIGGGKIFYRPVTYTTFAIDQFFWGWNPVGFHLTNLILHAASTLGLFFLARHLTGRRGAAWIVAGVFAAMPIQVESVGWMAGRFDVLSTCLSIWTVAAYLSFRARGGAGRYVVALALCALAMCSKETAFVLPILLGAVEVLVFRSLPISRLAGFFVTGAVLFAWRWIALGGFGGYRSGESSGMIGFGWKTLEALFVRGPSQLLLGFNWTQPSELLPVIATLTAALLIFIIVNAAVTKEHGRILLLGCVWMFVAMIPGHFLLSIGAGLSNSRILCLPSAGMALFLGQLVSVLPQPRTRSLAYGALAFLFSLGVLHNIQAWRWTSGVGAETLRQIVELEPSPPENAQFVVSNLPGDLRGVFFFQTGLNEGLQMFYRRYDIRAYRDVAPPGDVTPIRLKWTGDTDAGVLIRRE
jgi:hypothetical protein